MKRTNLIIIAIVVVILVSAGAIVAVVGHQHSDNADNEGQTSASDYYYTYTTEDLGETVEMYLPSYDCTAADSYAELSHHATTDGDTYHWVAYTITWYASDDTKGANIWPTTCNFACTDTSYPSVGSPYKYDINFNIDDMVYIIPTADHALPSSAVVNAGSSATYTLIIPVHIDVGLTLTYPDDGWSQA